MFGPTKMNAALIMSPQSLVEGMSAMGRKRTFGWNGSQGETVIDPKQVPQLNRPA